jgi:hypothetical protein
MNLRNRQRRAEISGKVLNESFQTWLRGRLLSVQSDDPSPWRHPWFTQVFWDSEAERFFARVKPGFCIKKTSGGTGGLAETIPGNEGDVSFVAEVAVSLNETEAPADTLERLGIDSPSGSREVESYLTEGPMIPIDPVHMYTPSIVPDFFQSRGVADAGAVSTEVSGAGGIITRVEGFQADAAETRQLRAVDVELLVDRTRVNVRLDYNGADLGLSVDLDVPVSDASRLRITRMVQRSEPETSVEQLIENTVDSGVESIRIATIYFLSPLGKGEGAEVDRTWQSFIEHAVFWNLELREKVTFPEVQPSPLAFSVPEFLGAGAGRTANAVAKFILDDINARQTEVLALLEGYKVESRFVTA